MRKSVTLLVIGSLSFLSASETLSEAFEKTVYKGQLRYYAMQRSYDELLEDPDGVFNVQNEYQKVSNAIGGYLGFESGSFYHFSVGATFYTSLPIFYNPSDEGGLQILKDNQDAYGVLGEAFIKWEHDQTILKIGRQLLSDYRFLSDNDIRMTPYTYEGAILENRDLENITLRLACVSGAKTHASTNYIDFVNASKDLLREVTIDRNPIRGDYNPAYYDENSNYIGPEKNLYLGSIVYQNKQVNLEFWNYYADDFVNIVYTMGSYAFQTGSFSNSIGIEGVKQNDIGEHVAGTINTYAYDMMVKSTYDNFSLQYVFSKVKYDEASLDGGTIIDQWGGGMLYGGLIYNGADQGGSIGHSLSFGYDFVSYDMSILLTTAKFNFPNKITDIFADQDNKEYDFILNYTPDWNQKLHFKVEAMYVDFDTNYNFKAYEDLHGFNMLHTYDDILDLRFIVNYSF